MAFRTPNKEGFSPDKKEKTPSQKLDFPANHSELRKVYRLCG